MPRETGETAVGRCHACGAEVAEFDLVCPKCEAPVDTTLFSPEFAAGALADASAAVADEPPAPETPVFARFIVSDALREPFELEPGQLVRIGRSRSNEICLPSGHVSRLHAELVWERGRWHVGDLGSKNGTWVNEQRVIRRPLCDRDRIRCGHFVLTYRELDREETQRLLASARERLGRTQTARISADEGFTGDLSEIRLVEVVQLLHNHRKSGVMLVQPEGAPPDETAELHFHEGQIVHACCGGRYGEPVALDLLRTPSGTFHFKPGRETGGPTIGTPTDSLLLQAALG